MPTCPDMPGCQEAAWGGRGALWRFGRPPKRNGGWYRRATFIDVTAGEAQGTRRVTPRWLKGEWFAAVTSKLLMAENNRLKAARVLRGLTQLQLAARIGKKEIEVSRFETGRAEADAEVKRRIAEVLGKPAFELFDA